MSKIFEFTSKLRVYEANGTVSITVPAYVADRIAYKLNKMKRHRLNKIPVDVTIHV